MDLMAGCYTAHEDSWLGYVRVEAHKLSLWSRRRDDDHQWELSRIIELDKDSSGNLFTLHLKSTKTTKVYEGFIQHVVLWFTLVPYVQLLHSSPGTAS
jgi:hypothetical protein